MMRNQRGSGLLLVIVVFATLFALLGVSLERGVKLFERIHRNHLEDVALNLAEAGVEYSIHQLTTSEENFQREHDVFLDTGTFSVSISALYASGNFEILSTGTAKGTGRIGDVVKTLRVRVQFDPKDVASVPVIYSREEIL